MWKKRTCWRLRSAGALCSTLRRCSAMAAWLSLVHSMSSWCEGLPDMPTPAVILVASPRGLLSLRPQAGRKDSLLRRLSVVVSCRLSVCLCLSCWVIHASCPVEAIPACCECAKLLMGFVRACYGKSLLAGRHQYSMCPCFSSAFSCHLSPRVPAS